MKKSIETTLKAYASFFRQTFQLDLAFDDENRYYTNLTAFFSLFGDRNLHICGTNFYGYVQDVR